MDLMEVKRMEVARRRGRDKMIMEIGYNWTGARMSNVLQCHGAITVGGSQLCTSKKLHERIWDVLTQP